MAFIVWVQGLNQNFRFVRSKALKCLAFRGGDEPQARESCKYMNYRMNEGLLSVCRSVDAITQKR